MKLLLEYWEWHSKDILTANLSKRLNTKTRSAACRAFRIVFHSSCHPEHLNNILVRIKFWQMVCQIFLIFQHEILFSTPGLEFSLIQLPLVGIVPSPHCLSQSLSWLGKNSTDGSVSLVYLSRLGLVCSPTHQAQDLFRIFFWILIYAFTILRWGRVLCVHEILFRAFDGNFTNIQLFTLW